MKIVRIISRLLVGIVFVFSGFVKAVDPLGFTYKLSDYLHSFGTDFLIPLTFPVAIILSSTELLIGIALLLNYRIKIIAWIVLLFMSFFTVLTFILAIYNPVTDCGCFGDAIILTNWETFFKNVILMVFTLIIFAGRNKYPVIRADYAEWGILAFFFIAVTALSVYCYNHLPILDFRPYKTGTNIPQASEIPPDAVAAVYDTRLFYRNKADGKVKEFTLENFPQDSLWEFENAESVPVSKGYEPPIHDFSINGPNKQNITENISGDKGFVFLLISYNLNNADTSGLRKANNYFKLASVFNDVSFYAVTASLDDDIRKVTEDLKINYDFGTADEIALKTIIRSNPGLLIIKNGTILGKFHFNDFPEISDFGKKYTQLLNNYPLSEGVDLNVLNIPPAGAKNDVYKTSLTYHNVINDSVANFSVEDYPKTADWTFVSSNSEKIKDGSYSPLKDFKMINANGTDLSESIRLEKQDVFIYCVKDPATTTPELLERINRLSMVGINPNGQPALFYGMTAYQTDEIIRFNDYFVTPVVFCSTPVNFVESVAGNGAILLHLRDGKVLHRWDNNSIPDADTFKSAVSYVKQNPDFESSIMPYLLNKYRNSTEKGRIYILILGFLFLSLFIRVFFEDPFIKGRNRE